MADRMLMINWGTPVRGREERGLEVFNEAIGLYGRMQQEGRIESFDVCLCTPNAKLNGYIELFGSADQLNALKVSDDYQRTLANAVLVVDDVCVCDCVVNEGIAEQMAIYQEAISKVPQAV
jgi:hypothetical protein